MLMQCKIKFELSPFVINFVIQTDRPMLFDNLVTNKMKDET